MSLKGSCRPHLHCAEWLWWSRVLSQHHDQFGQRLAGYVRHSEKADRCSEPHVIGRFPTLKGPPTARGPFFSTPPRGSAGTSEEYCRFENAIYRVFSILRFFAPFPHRPACYFLVIKNKNFSDNSPPEQQAESLIAAIDAAIKSITTMLTARAEEDEDLDWSLADLLKLLQVRKGISAEQPKRVVAFWVDDPEAYHAARRKEQEEQEQQGPRLAA